MFDWKRKKDIDLRKREEKLYALVVQELKAGLRRDGLWAKSIAKSKGNDAHAKALYIEYRVQSIIDEFEEEAITAKETMNAHVPSQEDAEKEAKIVSFLKENLGRMPTEQEIRKIKWTWDDEQA